MRLRFLVFSLAFSILSLGSVAVDANPSEEPVDEIVITLEDLDTFTQARLRIFALSNEITLRVGAKQEDLEALYEEFNTRAFAILESWDIPLQRYNEIERAAQLIPNIQSAIGERVRDADPRLRALARQPETLADAKKLLQGRVSYAVNAANFPWLADGAELEELTSNYIGGKPSKGGTFPGMPSFPGMGAAPGGFE